MSDRFERLTNLALAVSALAIAGVVVRRELFPAKAAAMPEGEARQTPIFVNDWKSITQMGSPIGHANAPITVVEFGDLECPYCKVYHNGTLSGIRKTFGNKVVVSFVHYPISTHRFARPAARAAECAKAVGQFGVFVDAVYGKQDSLGLKSWTSYARDAGIADTATFRTCTAATTPLLTVDSGVAVGKRLLIKGTPSIMLNGWLFEMPPTEATLSKAIAALLSGSPPFRAASP